MRSTEDISFDHIRITQAMEFLMDKLKELDEEYAKAFLKEQRDLDNAEKSKKVKEGWGYYQKGELILK